MAGGDQMPKWPFHRARMAVVCFVCGSGSTNDQWGCPTCAPHKKLANDARDGRHDGAWQDAPYLAAVLMSGLY